MASLPARRDAVTTREQNVMVKAADVREEAMRTQANRRTRLGGIIAPLWFTALVAIQGFLQPDYSDLRMLLSALAAWPLGWIQNLNFFVAGALAITLAISLHRAVQARRQADIVAAVYPIGIQSSILFHETSTVCVAAGSAGVHDRPSSTDES
jgi:Protein of unknown function (DUF998)